MKDGRRYQDVAEELRQHIITTGYAPGDRIITERQMAEMLDVGRGMVRDAVIMLEVQGLVSVRKGSGIYLLRPPQTEATPDGSATAPEDDIGPFELLQARQILEGAIAEFAAAMVTKNDILRMREALQAERLNIDTGTPDDSADEAFHRLIAEATQNGVLVAGVERLWDMRRRSRMWAQLHDRIFDTGYRRQWLDDHTAILNALQARDGAASKRAMQTHLANVSDTLMALSDVDDPQFDGYLFATSSLP